MGSWFVKAAPAALALMVLAACGSSSLASSQTPAPAATTPSASAPSPSPSPSPSPVPSPSPSPVPSPSPTPPPVSAGSINIADCPAYAPGQHPLGSPGPPGVGVHADPTLDWTGCGSIVVPPGTARFMTGNNWQLGFAATCPNDLNYQGGFGPNVTFNELLLNGSLGPDSQAGAGPWTDSGGGIMAHGGNYQIKVTSIDPRCRWHVAVYWS